MGVDGRERGRGTPHGARDVVVGLAPCSLGVLGVALAGDLLWQVVLAADAEAAHASLGGGPLTAAGSPEVAAVLATVEAPWRPLAGGRAPRGTPFQARVWGALAKVGAGATISYRDLARDVGLPSAARAVAMACAANPWAVVVPCHRVVRTCGGLGGYRWGLERKRVLLAREQAWAHSRQS